MNKQDFINALKEKLNLDEEKCTMINSIIEDNFIIGKIGKEKIIAQLVEKLKISEEEADNIYNKAMEIIKSGITSALKNQFGSKD